MYLQKQLVHTRTEDNPHTESHRDGIEPYKETFHCGVMIDCDGFSTRLEAGMVVGPGAEVKTNVSLDRISSSPQDLIRFNLKVALCLFLKQYISWTWTSNFNRVFVFHCSRSLSLSRSPCMTSARVARSPKTSTSTQTKGAFVACSRLRASNTLPSHQLVTRAQELAPPVVVVKKKSTVLTPAHCQPCRTKTARSCTT